MNQALIFLTIAISPLAWVLGVSAQDISPDTTLPDNTVVETTGNTSEITGGTVRGTNLFHSFFDFSIGEGGIANFTHDSSITNILGRVTGSSPSAIDGLITAGNVDLFLINPNGIVFGENAALDIGGTFTAATAESILFEGGEFNAVNPSQSVLSVNVPTGAQLGNEAATVTVFGRGNNLFWDDYAETIIDDRPDGLSNDSGVRLIAGNININGGNVTSTEGLVDLVAASGAKVNFGSRMIPEEGAVLGDINLSNAASVSTTGDGSGTINAYGANLSVKDGSAILSMSQGEGPVGGGINLDFADKVEIIAENEFGDFPTYVSTDVGFFSSTPGSNINVNTGDLNILLGAQMNAGVFGEAPGGNVNINANNISIQDGGSFTDSGIYLDSSGLEGADSGTLIANADSIEIGGAGRIASKAYYDGNAGTINLNAREINVYDKVDFGDGFVLSSAIENSSEASGDAGTININTQDITISDGAQILTYARGEGDAGSVNINTTNLRIETTYPDESEVDTGIIAGSGNEVPTEDLLGKGGDININADTIELVDGGIISSGTLSANDGGNITINTNQLHMFADHSTDTTYNGGIILSRASSSGNSGSININANSTVLEGGSQINVGTVGSGNAGTLKLNTDTLKVDGFVEDYRTALLSTAVEGSGDGGTIEVAANSVEVTNGATISASNFPTRDASTEPGTGAAGNIKLDTDNLSITGDEPTTINTSTSSGGGGQIELNANNISLTGTGAAVTAESLGSSDGGKIVLSTTNLNLDDGGSITTSAIASGNAGDITIDAKEIEGNTGKIIAESQVSGGGEIAIDSENIDLNQNSLISTSVAQSDGGGGNLRIDNSDTILLRNNSDIRANAEFGPGGNIEIITELLFADGDSDVDASSTYGLDGVVEIDRSIEEPIETDNLPEQVEDPNKLITAICPVGDDNIFAVVGKGGRATDNTTDSTWQEVSGVPVASNSQVKPKVKAADSTPIKEANGIFLTPQKEVIVAHQSTAEAVLNTPWYQNASCSNSKK